MALSHGIDQDIYMAGYDMGAFLDSVQIQLNADIAESSILDDTDKQFIVGLRSALLSGSGRFDGSANAVDAIFVAAFAGESVVSCFMPAGDAHSNVGYGVMGNKNQYGITTPLNDVVAVSFQLQSDVGGERGIVLHALGAETVDGGGTQHDNTTSSSAGASAYLIVTDVTGTSTTLDVKVEHSTTGAWGGEEADLITFAQVTADYQAERKATSATATVNRYTRVFFDLGITTTSATFFVLFVRN